jgi:hypothetical protein
VQIEKKIKIKRLPCYRIWRNEKKHPGKEKENCKNKEQRNMEKKIRKNFREPNMERKEIEKKRNK